MKRSSLVCFTILSWLLFNAVKAEAIRVPVIPPDADTATLVSYTPVFHERIVWVGSTLPPEEESRAVLDLLGGLRKGDALRPDWAPMEMFIREHPDSAWTPSLEASLASWYRDHGRYTRALAYWEAAWTTTKGYEKGPGKGVADFAFVHWTRLLASLGRIQNLAHLIQETQGRKWDAGPLQRIWEGTLEGYSVMLAQPGISYRCGTYALSTVARKLKGDAFQPDTLLDLNSPSGGFSLEFLTEQARSLGLGLVPARRIEGEDIPFPSVVHWRQNHYAAVLERRDGFYRVVDPTFGHEVWLDADTINEETSGVFLMLATSLDSHWQQLEPLATTKVFGQGFPNNIDDPDDEPCQRGQDGAEGGTGCSTCGQGMPTWRVSEPYITLWLDDEPLAYQPSLGDRISFRLHYKHRDTRSDAYVYSVGTHWGLEWQTYVTPLGGSQAKLYVGGGGERVYSTTFVPDFKTDSTMTAYSGPTIYQIDYADGSQDKFKDPAGLLGDMLLSERRNRTGQHTHFVYDNGLQNRLVEVWDSDGHVNSLSYTNTAFPLCITSISDPFGRTARLFYDGSGQLTNITDTAGNATALNYDTNGNLSSMVTPYGTTSFQIAVAPPNYDPSSGQTFALGGTNLINRSLLITEATGAKQLYLYRDQCTELNATNHTAFIADSYSLPDTSPYSNKFEDHYNYYRNSFHWNRQQYAAISSSGKSDFKSLTVADYLLSRRKHWLHEASGKVSSIISAVQEPSPDGIVEGQRFWFDYAGKSVDQYTQGTNADPLFVAYIEPDGTSAFTRWERNVKRYPTSIVSTFSVGGTRYLRTNAITYDAFDNNPVTLQLATLGVTDSLGGIAYYPASARISQTTDAVGDVTVYGYDRTDLPTYASPAHVDLLTNLFLPSGLSVSNIFYTTGFYTNWLQQSIRPEIGFTNSYTYADGLIATFQDERGMTVVNTWDSFRRLVSRAFPDGTTISNVYDRLDLVGTKDREGNWTRFGYNALRQLTCVTNALGNITGLGYCDCGSLSSVTNGYGSVNLVTSFTHDYAGRLTQVTRNDGSWIAYQYDLLGRRTGVTDSAGYSLATTFNLQGLPITASTPAGQVFAATYDHRNRPTNIVDATGVAVSLTYDGLDRVLTRSFADGTGEGFLYVANGLISFTNRLSVVSTFTNDAAGRRIYESLAGQYAAKFDYSAANDLTRLRVGNTRTNTWTYDLYGRLTAKLDYAGNTNFIHTYSPNGWLATRWTPEKLTTTYLYDALGRMTNVDYPSSADVAFQYDAIDRLTGMVDGVGTTAFTYGPDGHLQTEEGPWSADRLTYGYNAGRRSSLAMGQPSGSDWQQTYAYDSSGRLQTTADPNGTYGYNYVSASQLVSGQTFPNGGYVTNTYDATLKRLSGTTLKDPAGTTLSTQAYLYDASGRLTNTTRWDGSAMRYAYNNLGELISATAKESGGTSRVNEQFGYGYDGAMNLVTRTNNQLTLGLSPDVRDRLQSISRSGTITVAGASSSTASSVTVNGSAATRYGDRTFALAGLTLTNGNNSYTAIGQDSLGRKDTNTVTVNLPSSAGYTYDQNGNLTSDGLLGFAYDDANRLSTVTSNSVWQSRWIYDGLGRRRLRREYAWTAPAATAAGITAVTPSATVRNNFSGFVGCQLVVGTNDLSLTDLGRWVRTGNSGTHTVKLVQTNGVDVPGASVSVSTSGATAGQYKYVSLAAPVTLPANTTYYLVSQETNGGDTWYDRDTGLTPAPGISLTGQCWMLSGGTNYTVYSASNQGYVPTGLKFTTTGWTLTAEVRYVDDGLLAVQERDGNNAVTAIYTRGRDLGGSLRGAGGVGGLLARSVPGAYGPTPAYYHHDGSGNVSALMTAPGGLGARYAYDPFGNTLYASGPLAAANPYRFSGKEWHAGSGLYDYGLRSYHPNLQRWVTQDPLGEFASINLYGFNYNSPPNFYDPDGLTPAGAAIGGAIGGVIGGVTGGIFGGAGGTLVCPGLGTLAGAGELGALGAGAGLALGGTLGNFLSDLPDILWPGHNHQEEDPGDAPTKPNGEAAKPGKGKPGFCPLPNANPPATEADDDADNPAPLPSLDSTGKVHGKLPSPKDLGNYTRDELEQLEEELEQSVQERIRVTVEKGRDKPHGQRQGLEQDLIWSIRKILENM